MPLERDVVRLRDILAAAEEAIHYAQSMSEQMDFDSRPIEGLLLYNLVVIGEAAARISDDTRAKIPLPWREIIGMRNRLVHAYHDVNQALVLRTVRDFLPEATAAIRAYLHDA